MMIYRYINSLDLFGDKENAGNLKDLKKELFGILEVLRREPLDYYEEPTEVNEEDYDLFRSVYEKIKLPETRRLLVRAFRDLKHPDLYDSGVQKLKNDIDFMEAFMKFRNIIKGLVERRFLYFKEKMRPVVDKFEQDVYDQKVGFFKKVLYLGLFLIFIIFVGSIGLTFFKNDFNNVEGVFKLLKEVLKKTFNDGAFTLLGIVSIFFILIAGLTFLDLRSYFNKETTVRYSYARTFLLKFITFLDKNVLTDQVIEKLTGGF